MRRNGWNLVGEWFNVRALRLWGAALALSVSAACSSSSKSGGHAGAGDASLADGAVEDAAGGVTLDAGHLDIAPLQGDAPAPGKDEQHPPADVGRLDAGGTGPDTLECGQFREPCKANKDCCSNFCVQGAQGFECAMTCLDECPDGYSCKVVINTWPDVISICVPDVPVLCRACTSDFDCNGGQCEAMEGGSFCVSECETVDCPPGYDCEPNDAGVHRCVPASGSCNCNADNAGILRPCASSNEFGTCSGVQECLGDEGWGPCDAPEPAQEVCDGIDNDCNGVPDDGLPPSKPCEQSNEFGSCTGAATCGGTAGWLCDAPEPAAETCNYEDDDCDGLVDEDFKDDAGRYIDVHNCGGCGKDCEGLFPHATATCDADKPVPQCAVASCEDGYYKEGDFQCLPQQDTLCDPCVADFQCAGGVCVVVGDGTFCAQPCQGGGCPDGFSCKPAEAADGSPKGYACVPDSGACDCLAQNAGDKKPCVVANDLGSCVGFQTCEPPGGWSACDAGEPTQEVCDGVDNDCNGFVDDGLPATKPCTNEVPGVGACSGEAVCLGAQGWVCKAPEPAVDLCDYVDNDCDGLTDEDFKDANGKYASDDNCGACGVSCADAIPNGTATCDASGPTPLCVVASCDDGYYPYGDFLCLPEGQSFCAPCSTDGDCQGGVCSVIDTGSFCTTTCSSDDDCPAGATCQEAVDAAQGKVCIPANGTCDCTPATAGAKHPCEATNAIGTCPGFEVCDPAVGWLPCDAAEPSVEVCDGVDNDCNGLVDDGLPSSKPCEQTNDAGTCQGEALCLGAQGWVCQAPEPAPETCNLLDDDCDGLTDEDFKNAAGKYASDDHCGACGIACGGTIPHATAETCDASFPVPKCVVQSCEDGYVQVGDFQCIAKPQVACFPCTSDADCFGGKCALLGDGLFCAPPCSSDGDCPTGFVCDGSNCMPMSGACDCTEANAGAKKFCSVSNEFGTCVGFQVCDPQTGWSACDAAEPSPEVCDGIDNDCNGIPDDGLPASKPCTNANAFGTCEGEATCQGSAGWVCQAPAPASEQCNYLDDDCDGLTDEDFKDAAGKYASDDHCGACDVSCGSTIPHAASETCDTSKPVPQCIVVDCEAGFFKQNEFQCVPQPAFACSPCADDAQCFGGTCTVVDQGMFCLPPCASDADCDAGFVCDLDGLCHPANGTCDCTETTAGAKRTCTASNDLGTCIGFETCDPQVGWTGCTAALPAPEVCDGVDNDCNGLIDDGLPSQQVCANKNAYGECAGVAHCFGAAGWKCDAKEPAPETCNYLDDDCDGLTDEDFKDAGGKYASNEHCGTCDTACGDVYPHSAAEQCDAAQAVPQCIVTSCEDGYFKLSDYQCLPIPDVACAPCLTDANCFGASCTEVDGGLFCLEACAADGSCPDGYVCSNGKCWPENGSCDCTPQTAGAKKACSVTNDTGTCYGFRTCDPATGWGPCDAAPASPEVCDGLDNDCNGFIDDGLPATQPCEQTNAYGSCAGEAVCYGAAGWVCQASEPQPETCNYLDDDCDGLTDEDFKNADGKYGSDQHCGGCNQSCSDAILNAVAVCDPTLEVPKCVVDTCVDGWQKYNDFLCIPITATLCESCATDDNCIGDGAACVPLSDGFFCSVACVDDLDCPSGYLCQDVGKPAKQCIPVTNSCTCDGTNTDLQMGCEVTYDPGGGGPQLTCFGTKYCTAQGWTDCQLPPETCNELDDDCDGLIDEDFKDASGKYVTDANCGKCGRNCAALDYPHGAGVCDVSLEVPDCVVGCDPGWFDVDGNPANGCECHFTSQEDQVDGVDNNCDGIDGDIDKGIFVSKDGDDANPGTIDAPKRTIQAGIDAAFAAGKRDVYVATGVYGENVALAPGVSVYGGYSADFTARDPLVHETAILGQPPTPEAPGALNALDIAGSGQPTIADGLLIFGFDNKAPGGNSYAVYARNCDARFVLRNNRIVGGAGGNGAPGQPGTDGADGVDGQPGASAKVVGEQCSGVPSKGGAGGTLSCNGIDVSGGSGGDGRCPAYDPAAQSPSEGGSPGANGGGAGGAFGYDGLISTGGGGGGPNSCVGNCGGQAPGGCYCDTSCAFFGDCCPDKFQVCDMGGGGGTGGGAGHCGACGLECGCNKCLVPDGGLSMNGKDGAPGTPGVWGAGGSGCSASAGSVVGGEWAAPAGAAGGAGGPGGGGGGGGAGGGVEVCGCGGQGIGGTGGGGGSGGCPGTGGTGGESGGGSFGVFLLYTSPPASAPVIEGNVIQRGNGGAGGAGGPGGTGGLPGAGGIGGIDGSDTDAFCAGRGGTGGDGGTGGHGGGGGGGCGGPSYGVFAWGQGSVDLSAIKSANTFAAGGSGGPGGPGGPSLGNPGNPGDPGPEGDTNF